VADTWRLGLTRGRRGESGVLRHVRWASHVADVEVRFHTRQAWMMESRTRDRCVSPAGRARRQR
jgi:hypothetical protein